MCMCMYPNARFVRLSGSLRTYARNTPNMHTCMHMHMQRMHAMFHMFRTNAPNNRSCGSSSKSVPVVDLRHSRRSAARLDLNTSCRPVSDKGFIPHADGVQLQEGLLRGKLGVDVDRPTRRL